MADGWRDYWSAEHRRATDRITRLAETDETLASYERCYARGAPGAALHGKAATWSRSVAVYPAAVRARSLATAASLGADVGPELTEAARLVVGQLEFALLGNHLLEDAIGLACAAAVTVGAESDLWSRVAGWLLGRELPEQFLPDGGHFERSATYHAWMTAGLLELLELQRAHQRHVFPVEDYLASALHWLGLVVGQDGELPLFNDASLDACPPAGILLDLGRLHGLVTSAAVTPTSVLLPQTGWIVARVGSAQVIADAGPVGASYIPGHAHADTLTFEAWSRGRRVVFDYGTATYRAGDLRRATRSTTQHNTVSIDGRDSSEMWAEFRVGRRAQARVRAFRVEPGLALWEASHDGYTHLRGRPTHTRRWRLDERGLEVRDVVVGEREHELTTVLRGERSLNVIGLGSPQDDYWYPFQGCARPATRWLIRRRAVLPHRHSWQILW